MQELATDCYNGMSYATVNHILLPFVVKLEYMSQCVVQLDRASEPHLLANSLVYVRKVPTLGLVSHIQPLDHFKPVNEQDLAADCYNGMSYATPNHILSL